MEGVIITNYIGWEMANNIAAEEEYHIDLNEEELNIILTCVEADMGNLCEQLKFSLPKDVEDCILDDINALDNLYDKLMKIKQKNLK